MAIFIRMLALAALATSWIALPASAAGIDPKVAEFIAPENIKWVRNAAGTNEQAVLFGDPSKPGPYVVRLKWLPGNMSRPHYHSTLRYFYVASGTWWVGSSNTYDPAKTYPMRAGTFVTHYAGKAHFDGAKDEPGVLFEVGQGPIVSTPCKQPSDCPQ